MHQRTTEAFRKSTSDLDIPDVMEAVERSQSLNKGVVRIVATSNESELTEVRLRKVKTELLKLDLPVDLGADFVQDAQLTAIGYVDGKSLDATQDFETDEVFQLHLSILVRSKARDHNVSVVEQSSSLAEDLLVELQDSGRGLDRRGRDN